MTVWTVISYIPYEGQYLYGIFSTEELAEEYRQKNHKGEGDVVIEPWTLDEET